MIYPKIFNETSIQLTLSLFTLSKDHWHYFYKYFARVENTAVDVHVPAECLSTLP